MAVHLSLFVAGTDSATQRLAAALRSWCERHLDGAYRLDILDVGLHPEEARRLGVLAVPTLLLDGGAVRLVGDLSDAAAVMARLLGQGSRQLAPAE